MIGLGGGFKTSTQNREVVVLGGGGGGGVRILHHIADTDNM